MSGKISKILREYIFGLSILAIILGFIVLIIGMLGIWMPDALNFLNLSDDILSWFPYILLLGILILLTGIFYLYSFMKNKRFLMEEIDTKRRSDFIKKHQELKNAVRYLPSKYQDMLKEKEKELKIK